MSNPPVLLILGAGSRIGTSVAEAFSAKGYKTALVSRSTPDSSTNKELHIQADLSDPGVVPGIFEKAKAWGGEYPSVVVYNGASSFLPSSPLPLLIIVVCVD